MNNEETSITSVTKNLRGVGEKMENNRQLYAGFNGRIFCEDCAGMTARLSKMKRDLHGVKIIKITEEDKREWLNDVGSPMRCEQQKSHRPRRLASRSVLLKMG